MKLSSYKVFKEVVRRFTWAMNELHYPTTLRQAEKWAMLVLDGMSSPSRIFHNPMHILELTAGMDPLATLAGLYHDLVYYQVDGGVAPCIETKISQYFTVVNGVLYVAHIDDDPTFDLVLGVFGFVAGQKLLTTAGQNEFLSALVAVVELSGTISRSQQVMVACCIEATIPFRNSESSFAKMAIRLQALSDRLDLNLTATAIEAIVHRAIAVANKDVDNFAAKDPRFFVYNTWRLLPEINLRLASTLFTVREYRIALQKMHRFLSSLHPEDVFHQYQGYPAKTEYQRLMQRTRSNLKVGLTYLATKLYTAAIMEAITQLTGGDIPLVYFMGDIKNVNQESRRIENHLSYSRRTKALDHTPIVRALLEVGFTRTKVRRRLKSSPISAFLYRYLGEKRILEGQRQADLMFREQMSSMEFLRLQDTDLVLQISRASSKIAESRKKELALFDNFLVPGQQEDP